MKVSFLVCTHNGERTISCCLQSILAVKVPTVVNFVELIVCSNGCVDLTESIIDAVFKDVDDDSSFSLQNISLPVPGKSAALRAAMDAAQGEYLVIIDDDNYIPRNWLERLVEFINSNEKFGILGTASKLPALTEQSLEHSLLPYLKHYAVGASRVGAGNRIKTAWGAGCVISRSMWLNLRECGFTFFLTGRVGSDLVAGEDSELCLAAQLLGYSIIYTDEVVLVHDIQPERLRRSYLLRLVRSEGVVYGALGLYCSAIERGSITLFEAYKLQALALLRSVSKALVASALVKFSRSDLNGMLRAARYRGIALGIVRFRKQIPLIVEQISKINDSALRLK